MLSIIPPLSHHHWSIPGLLLGGGKAHTPSVCTQNKVYKMETMISYPKYVI